MKTEIPKWILDCIDNRNPGRCAEAVEELLAIIETLRSGKPDWKDAPEWANYMAQDADGNWRCFEFKPEFITPEEFWRHWSGREMTIKPAFAYVDPETSLEKRPNNEK